MNAMVSLMQECSGKMIACDNDNSALSFGGIISVLRCEELQKENGCVQCMNN